MTRDLCPVARFLLLSCGASVRELGGELDFAMSRDMDRTVALLSVVRATLAYGGLEAEFNGSRPSRNDSAVSVHVVQLIVYFHTSGILEIHHIYCSMCRVLA